MNKKLFIICCDIKQIAHFAVRFDTWVVLRKLNSSFYVKSDKSFDPFR